jgi:glyoxylase-like metal-dependent hydrolase (beta-lactamase superfamily II)
MTDIHETGQHKRSLVKAFEKEYGVHRIRVGTHLPDFKVNVYFVEKPVPTLIDAPPEGRPYLDELSVNLGPLGYAVEDIGRIIVTHPHFDHFGSAWTIAEKSGAEIWASQGGARWLEDYEGELHREEMANRLLLQKAGAPASEIKYVTEFYRQAHCFARGAKPSRRLRGGDTFDLASLSFTVTEVPGHTPWCILIHDVCNLMAFGGDFLIKDDFSNPLVQIADVVSKEYETLKSYISSLVKVREMNFKVLFPGHGKIIQNPSKTIDDLLGFIGEKRMAIHSILQKGSQTLFQITHALFSDLPRDRLLRAISDVLGHLEILEEEGLVERKEGTPVRFSPVRARGPFSDPVSDPECCREPGDSKFHGGHGT